jgi:hypothetical protein
LYVSFHGNKINEKSVRIRVLGFAPSGCENPIGKLLSLLQNLPGKIARWPGEQLGLSRDCKKNRPVVSSHYKKSPCAPARGSFAFRAAGFRAPVELTST